MVNMYRHWNDRKRWDVKIHKTKYYGIYVQEETDMNEGCDPIYWIVSNDGNESIGYTVYPTEEMIKQYACFYK